MVSTENAIVMKSSKDSVLLDYLMAIGNIISPTDVLEAGSKGAYYYVFFLKTKEATEKLINKGIVDVKDIGIQIQPFIANVKTITLKGAPPHLCNSEMRLMPYLNPLGRVVKSMEKVAYGNFPAEWAHVMSFTRKIVMQVQKPEDIPNFIKVKDMEGKEYKIFLEHGPRKCHKCGSLKHVAQKCKFGILNGTQGTNDNQIQTRVNNNQQSNTSTGVGAKTRGNRPIFQFHSGFDSNAENESEGGTQSDGFQTITRIRKSRKIRNNNPGAKMSPQGNENKKSRPNGTSPEVLSSEHNKNPKLWS